ncbi:MAG: hypothetical protein K2Q10_06810 [Rhodospirillales bacterium]|nr:hypothetical protein [Rhodospirillales bacterium]
MKALAAVLLALSLTAAPVWAQKPGKAPPPPVEEEEIDPFTLAARKIPNHRQLMREIVTNLSAYARQRNPKFTILARDGLDLIAKGWWEHHWEELRDPEGKESDKRQALGTPSLPYIRAIDGMIVNGLLCGHDQPDAATSEDRRKALMDMATPALEQNRKLWAIEYCRGEPPGDLARSAGVGRALSYLSSDGPRLATIPKGHAPAENAVQVLGLENVRNFLPVLRQDNHPQRGDWIAALKGTNFDALIVDVFASGQPPLNAAEIHALKFKKLGSPRLVFAVMPLGKARGDRFYWQAEWKVGNPAWIAAAAPDDPGTYVVQYWAPEWKEILGRTIQGLMDLGFDGVVYDDLNAYEYFEKQMPLE